MAEWVAAFAVDQAPATVRHEAGRSLLDVVGVSLAGADHIACRQLRALAAQQYGGGDCTVLGATHRGPAFAAALVNGTAAHVLDFDDVSYDGMVHASAVVWPAVLAAAELADSSGQLAFDAFVAAVEVHCALGRAFTHGMFWRGFWTTGLLGSIAAAAGAAKAMALDVAATTSAIEIAMAQASGMRVIVGTPMKAVACGLAAEAGVRAALMAQAGIGGLGDVAGHRYGLASLLNGGVLHAAEIARLGQYYVFDKAPMAFKLYPVCSYGQAAVEALQDALTALGAPAARVRCEVPAEVLDNMPFAAPTSTTEAQFSVPFSLGAVLAFGSLAPSHLAAATIGDPRLAVALGKIEVSVASGAAALALDGCSEAAVVTVTAVDGRSISSTVRVPTGMPQRPLSDERLESKFYTCADPVIGKPAAIALRRRIADLPALPRVRSLYDASAHGDRAAAISRQ